MDSGQLGQRDDLRVGLGQPDQHAAQRVTGVPDGLGPVQVGLQLQLEVALDDGADRWRCRRGDHAVGPAAAIPAPRRWQVDLADLEQQHVGGVQPRERGGAVLRRRHLVTACPGSGVAGPQALRVGAGGERADRLAELDQVAAVDGGHVGVAAVEQEPSQRPGQQVPGLVGCVAELDQPLLVACEELQVDPQPAGVGPRGERAREGPGQQQLVVQADALDQRQVGQVRHDHVRAVASGCEVGDRVGAAFGQRGGEPLLQRRPPRGEAVVDVQPVGPDRGGAVLSQPAPVAAAISVATRTSACPGSRAARQACHLGAHRRPRRAWVYSVSTASSETRV